MLPTLLIVTDYRELHAYLIQPDGVAVIVKHIDFQCDCPTNVPLIDFHAGEHGHLHLAEAIGELVRRYDPNAWALGCEEPLMRRLLDRLDSSTRSTLALCKVMDVGRVTVANVAGAFSLCSTPVLAEPEQA